MADDKLQAKKFAVLDKICGQLQKKFGKGSVNYLGNNKIEPLERIPTGSIALDEITGGGYPVGRMIELFGQESCGKSTTCYHAMAEAQRKFPDKFVALIDSEMSNDNSYASALGVKVEELVVSQPDSGQDAFAIIQGLIETGACSLIVVDSVAALVPREETEEDDYGKSMVGVQARMMSKSLRKLSPIAARYGTTIIFTNQQRTKIGVMYGDPSTTSGGNALKYYDSIRIKLSKIGTVDEGTGDDKEKVAVRIKAETVKNKVFPPFKKSEFVISFGKGIDNEASVIEGIVEKGIVTKKGAWISYNGENIAQGMTKFKELLANNKELYEEMKKKLEDTLKGNSVTVVKEEKIDAQTMTDEDIALEVNESDDSIESGEI